MLITPLSGKRNNTNYSGFGTITPLRVQNPSYKYISPKPIKVQQKPNLIQSAEQGIGKFFNTVKNEFSPQTKPLPKLGKTMSTTLPSGLKLDFVTPSQKASATMKVTPKSLKQEAQSVKQTQKILKPIIQQVNLAQKQMESGFSDLLNKGVVPNMGQVAPRKEYFTQKQYDQAVKNSKQQTFAKNLNSFLGTTIATAPLVLLGGQLIDPWLAKLAMRVPGGTNILTNALSLMTKAVIRSAPYGTLGALAPAKNTQERLTNTATGVAVASVLGIGIAGADAIASELVNKFGNDAVNFLANKELITKVVTGKATPEEIKQFNILNESGLTAEAARSKEGISINTTQQKQGKMWDILRYIFNNHYQPKTQGTENSVSSQQTATATQQTDNNLKLLQPGEYKPAEVRKIVLNSPLRNTPEGNQIIQHSIQAENQGQNVKVTHVQTQTKQLPATTEVTPKKPVYNSAQSRAIQSQFTDSLNHLQQTATSQEELVKGVDAAVSKAETLANGDKTVLAGVRTALNKMMFDFSGHSGNYKQDYAILQSLKDDPMIGDFIKTLEGHVNRISENMLKPSPQLIEKPASGENLLKPVGTGERQTSKLAQGVEQKAIEEGLTRKFGNLPEYQKVNMKEQAQMAADLVKNDPEKALQVALGNEVPPSGLLPEMVFTAVEQQAIANKDVILLRHLATQSSLSTEATAMGQRIRALAERDPNSPVEQISQVEKARQEVAGKKLGGKSIKTATNDKINTIKKTVAKNAPKKENWQSFIDSIQC